MRMRQWRMAAALAVTAVAAAACGGAGTGADARDTGELARTAGFDGSTIKLGMLTTLSGPVAAIGKEVANGNKAWFDHVNEKGGVAGRYRVELVQEDNQYKPDVTVQRYNKIKGDVVAFTQLLGTAATLAVLPQLKQDKILAAPASLDAFWVREGNLLPIGAPYQLQGVNSVEHYLAERDGGKDAKICVLGQDDVYGNAGLAGVEAAAGRHGTTVAAVQKYTMGTEDFTGQIGALRRAGCEMIYLGATPSDAGKIWGAAAQARFTPTWYAQGPAYVEAMAHSPIAPYLSEHVRVASFAPQWGDESVSGMKDMLRVIDKHAPGQRPDHYFVYGYAQARAMTEVLERAVANGDLSREGILRASQEIGKVGFDGLVGDYVYGPAGDRNPPRAVNMFAVDPDVPFGLRKIAEVTSPAAEEFKFVERK